MMRGGVCSALPTSERPTCANESGSRPPTPIGLWPTPTVKGNYNKKGLSPASGDGLATAVNRAHWPAPCAMQRKGWAKNHNRAQSDDRLDYTIERQAAESGETGRLNPDWVEWLMGWPSGWTDLSPLAMDRFHEWLRQHGKR